MSNINIGDVVQLKSGSCSMTVEDGPYNSGGYKCVWFVDGELKQGIFNLSSLQKVEA